MKVMLGPVEVAGFVASLTSGLRSIGVSAESYVSVSHRFGYDLTEKKQPLVVRLWCSLGSFRATNASLSLPLKAVLLGFQFALSWLVIFRSIFIFDAYIYVIIAGAWKQISANFIFFLAGLQAIQKSVIEASMIDCKNSFRRFWTITFPLLMPTTFFLIIINITYAFFDTFGIIDTTTIGAPSGETRTLVYKAYMDGFRGLDLGSAGAQSIMMMLIVLVITIFQFRYIEGKIHYN